ncbi:MAG: glycosyltransferase [Acidimicrobiales bacterium]
MTPLPLVTVLIPARNEAVDIEGCLRCVAAQDYPVNRIEVIVVDGASTDATAEIARQVLGRGGFASTAVFNNPTATTPSNLNVGLARATGDILCRVDARTRIEPHHVRTCVEVLSARPDVVVVGGAQVAVDRDGSARSRGIARALNNRYSMGGSAYRRATESTDTETVYLGAFRTAHLRAAGGWDERLPTNQDFELNRRLGRAGVVWFDARLRSGYVPRATVRDLWKQFRRFGEAKVGYWRTTGDPPRPRQLAALVAPLVAGVGMLLVGSWRSKVVAGVAGVVIVDELGSARRPAPPLVRLWSSVAVVAITGGWTVGAWRALVSRG